MFQKLASCTDEGDPYPEKVKELEKNVTFLENQLAEYEDSEGLLENNITDTERSLDDLEDELNFEKSTTAKVEVELDQTRKELKYTEDQIINFKNEMEKFSKTVESSSEDRPLIAELRIELDNLQRKIMDELISAEPKLKVRETEISSKLHKLYEKEKELESRIENDRVNLVQWKENLSVLHKKVNQTRKRISGTKKVRELEISLGKLETQLDEHEYFEMSFNETYYFLQINIEESKTGLSSVRKLLAEREEELAETKKEISKTMKMISSVKKSMVKLNETLESSGQDRLSYKLRTELDKERWRMNELIYTEQTQKKREIDLSSDVSEMIETIKMVENHIVNAIWALTDFESELAHSRDKINETRKRISEIQKEIEVSRREVEATE